MILKSRKTVNSILTVLLFLTSSLIAQTVTDQVNQQISRDSLLMTARAIIDSSRCRVLVTVDENGRPHAREISPFSPEENWIIWMGTTPGSRKTKQIQNNPNVVVYYYDTKGMSYVSVSGKARLVNDPDKKAKYWFDGWKRFYPDRDKNYILIEVTPERLEICSFKYNILWDPITGIPPSVDFGSIKTE